MTHATVHYLINASFSITYCHSMTPPVSTDEKASACDIDTTKSLTEAIVAGTAIGTTVTGATVAGGLEVYIIP